jgi:hypothetical protein
MSKIIIGFSTHKGALSWLIRTCLRTKYSHVYIKYQDDYVEETIIYQASGLAINMITEKAFLVKNNIVAERQYELDKDTLKAVIKFAASKLGTPYGVKQLCGMAFIQACRALGFKVRNPFPTGRTSYICSEFVAEILKKYKGIPFEHLDSLDPKDIYEIVME